MWDLRSSNKTSIYIYIYIYIFYEIYSWTKRYIVVRISCQLCKSGETIRKPELQLNRVSTQLINILHTNMSVILHTNVCVYCKK